MKDIDRLPALLRKAAVAIPVELDAVMAAEAEALLPQIQQDTPVGDGSSGPAGRLKAATRVQKMASGKVRFVNTQPYANAIHWGRKQIQGTSSVVRGSYFVYGPLADHQEQIQASLVVAVETALRRSLG